MDEAIIYTCITCNLAYMFIALVMRDLLPQPTSETKPNKCQETDR
jgi:hypothetical protein